MAHRHATEVRGRRAGNAKFNTIFIVRLVFVRLGCMLDGRLSRGLI